MSHHDPHDPADLLAADKAQLRKERIEAKISDEALAALNLPPQPVATIAPTLRTEAERVTLADYILGLVDRAGLLEVFRQLLINDVIETSDERRGLLLGLLSIEKKGDRLIRVVHVSPARAESTIDAEATGRKVGAQLAHRIAAEQERRMTEEEGRKRG